MKKETYYLFLIALGLLAPVATYAQETITIAPSHIVQGDAVMLQLPTLGGVGSVQSVSFNNSSAIPFLYGGKVSALIGIPLSEKPGDYAVAVTLTNGQRFQKTITVGARPSGQEVFTIARSLGGTTPSSTKRLVRSLAADNKSLKSSTSTSYALWQNSFTLPLSTDVVTDPFGYVRHTGAYSIPHMGLDFRAAIGTPVMAMNRGVIRIARKYAAYGNTVVIDHGLGLSTLYLHLSKINVHVGDTVAQGQVIGLTGDTGYVAGPHLHVSVHIGGVPVDPAEFLALFSVALK